MNPVNQNGLLSAKLTTNAADAYKFWVNKDEVDLNEIGLMEAFSAGYEAALRQRSNADTELILGGGHDYTGGPDVTAEEIWAAWPKKKARGAAIPAIKRAMIKTAPATLLEYVQFLAKAYADWPEDEKKFLPLCSSFMNQERWLDAREDWIRKTPTPAGRRPMFSTYHE